MIDKNEQLIEKKAALNVIQLERKKTLKDLDFHKSMNHVDMEAMNRCLLIQQDIEILQKVIDG